jgi:predicted DNA-binding protein
MFSMAVLPLLSWRALSLGANSEKITIRLTPDQVENIDTIMLNRDIKSRSKVIRMAIENYISENLTDVTSQKVMVHLPNTTFDRLVDCVSAGDVLNIDSAVQISIDRYLESITSYYLKQRGDLKRARLDEQKKRAARLAANNAVRR